MSRMKSVFTKRISMIMVIAILGTLIIMQPQKVNSFTASDADMAITAFNNAFWDSSARQYKKYNDSSYIEDFWRQANEWHVIMDAYQRTNSLTYYNMINDFYSGFTAIHGTNWSSNNWNDDILWMCLASLHAYDLTGNTTYRNAAKSNFDIVYARAYDTTFGGGLWNRADFHERKNNATNQPAIIAAKNLARVLNDNTYNDKASTLYSWVKNNLWDSNTGHVYDGIFHTGVTYYDEYTYNAGTFIECARLMGEISNACKAADYLKNNLCQANYILPSESPYDDLVGFKSIFVRYMYNLVYLDNQTQYLSWMQSNADSAWAYRRTSDNLTGADWNSSTPDGRIQSWAAVSAVELMQLFGGNGQPRLSGLIEAESSVKLGGARYYNDSAASNGEGIGYIANTGDGIQFNNAAASGTMTICYACMDTTQLSLYINGSYNQNISFASTGAWTGAYGTKTINAAIPEGATVVLKKDGSSYYGANIDSITFSSSNQIPLVNPGFESGNINGWTEWHPQGQAASYGVDSPDSYSGNYKCYFWGTGSYYEQSIHQLVTGLTNGSYTVKAWVKQNTGTASYCWMEVSNYGGAKVYANVPHGSVYNQYTLTVNVTNGQLDIGFYIGAPGNTNLQIDAVELWKN